MAKVVVKAKVKKVKRKFPVEIVAPEYLGSVSLGHSNVTDLNLMVGRTAKVNLMYVSKNVKNQNVRLTFRVTEVSSGLAKTQAIIYNHIPYYLGRFVKKGSDLVEDSFECVTKDKVTVKVKPFIVTKTNTNEMVLAALRKETREIIQKDALSKSFDEFMASVINGKVQNVYRNDLKKIFPLKTFEFRKVELK